MKKNTERKEVLALYVVQFSNLIIPLLSFPYLINILGVDNFGKVGFAQTLLLIFCFIIDFGFFKLNIIWRCFPNNFGN